MPFDPSIVPAALIAAVRRHEVVPLIGAGLSKQASGDIPNWRELLTSMLEKASDEGWVEPDERVEVLNLVKSDRYLMAAEHLASKFPGDAYLSFLEEKFRASGIRPSDAHAQLWRLEPSLVLTTNYDRIIENSYAVKYGEVPNVLTYRQADALQRALQGGQLNSKPPLIFKIHGSIEVPSDLILTERQYRELIYRQPGYRLVLSALFITRTILMIGFSVDDPELRLLLEAQRDALKYLSSPDYAFLSMSNSSVTARRLREDFGVQVVPYESSPGHPEVPAFLKYLADQLIS